MLGGTLKEVGSKRALKSVNTCWAALSRGGQYVGLNKCQYMLDGTLEEVGSKWALTSGNTCWAALSKRWAVSGP